MNRGKRKGFVTVTLIVLALVAAVLIDVIDGAAGSASTPSSPSTKSIGSDRATPGLTNGSGTSGSSGGSIGAGNYRTVGSSVNLRSGASTTTAIVTTMLDLGSPVTLSCYVRGSSVGGDPWWYRGSFISAHGYIAGYWVNTGPDPAKTHLPAC
jgi:hypothetical protein